MTDERMTKNCKEFERDLTNLINRWSLENMSNTPDFILARYLMSCLYAYNIASNDRVSWFTSGHNIADKKEL
jgi:hypothetical protein